MNVTGIVAEYNPFHNGHAYQIREARKLTDCDYCVAVISGDLSSAVKYLFSANIFAQKWLF